MKIKISDIRVVWPKLEHASADNGCFQTIHDKLLNYTMFSFQCLQLIQ